MNLRIHEKLTRDTYRVSFLCKGLTFVKYLREDPSYGTWYYLSSLKKCFEGSTRYQTLPANFFKGLWTGTNTKIIPFLGDLASVLKVNYEYLKNKNLIFYL